MRRTAVLVGYYGFGNAGDEAILEAVAGGLARRAPDTALTVVSGDPADTRRRHGLAGVFWRDVPAILDAVRASDAVVIGGGGLFQDYWGLDPSTLLTPRHGEIAFYAGPAVAAAMHRKPIFLHGLGFGPLASGDAKRYVRGVAEAASRISVRDAASSELLAAAGVDPGRIRIAADPAFALPARVGLAEAPPRRPVLGVALRPWNLGVEQAAWEREISRALQAFLDRTGGSILFLPFEKSPWTESDDFDLAARLRHGLEDPSRASAPADPLAPADLGARIAGCDAVLAMRFHAVVFAAAAGVPAVALAYDPKVSALAERLGMDALSIPLSAASADRAGAAIDQALSEKAERGRVISEAAARLRQTADDDLDGLARALSNPPRAEPVSPAMASLFSDALVAAAADASAARTESASAGERLESERAARRHETELFEKRLNESRQELSNFQRSRLWKTADLYWRARRAASRWLRPVLGRSPSDWAGPDDAARGAREASAMTPDHFFDVLWLAPNDPEGSTERNRERIRSFAAAGHRVLRPERPPGGEDAELAALESLRKGRGLGATALVVEDPAWLPAAERMRATRGGILVNATGRPDRSPAPADLVLDPAADFADVARAVAQAFSKVSVVVVTQDNLELNRLCLESLFSRTEWPNLEVIVVDNGSRDGTRAMLERDAAARPNLIVLANAGNRGFAAAANQGASKASGRYLVFLNNDTVLVRRSLSALVRRLQVRPKLGLVGPVTNAISNEARVDAGYARLDDLPAAAARWMDAHDGEDFEIPMLAFFCVALRREVWEAVGPLDERFGAGMFEDDDYNRRVRGQGFEIRCARDAFVHHWQKASFRKLGREAYLALYEENRRKYEQKWNAPAAAIAAAGRAGASRHDAALEGVRERVAGSRGAVVFLPSVGWGIHLFQRPHHLARAFAKAGWIAVFDCSNAQDAVDGFKEVEPNVFLYRGPAGVLERLPDPLLWSFPYNYDGRDGFPPETRVVYDWIDDLSVFPYDRARLEATHRRALSEATVVAAVAGRLHAEALALRPDALYLPNGVEYERFAAPASAPQGDPDLEGFVRPGRPIAGYYGALAEWFDYELVDEAARLRPDWAFLLIGPMYDRSLQGRPMLRRDNVRWIGPRDYHLLPGYLRLFDVATIPFRINPITTATSPLKLYEYFAGGKPVVTTPMPECEAFAEVEIAGDAPAFAAALDRARERGADPAFRDRLRALGRANSWAARVETALGALSAAPPARAETAGRRG